MIKTNFNTIQISLYFLLFVCTFSCSTKDTNEIIKPQQNITKITNKVVAVVNETQILADDIVTEIEQNEEITSKEQALEEIIKRILLSDEAQKRGFHNYREVTFEKKKSQVFAFLTAEAENFTKNDIPEQSLKNVYKTKKSNYVHDDKIKVIHAVVKTKTIPDKEKLEIAKSIKTAVENSTSESDFKKRANSIKKNKNDFKIESLPKFVQKGSFFEQKFVDEAFAVDFPSTKISDVFTTSFGYHVLMVISREEPKNIPYKQAKSHIKNLIFESERKKYITQKVSDLVKDKDIFIHDAIDEQ